MSKFSISKLHYNPGVVASRMATQFQILKGIKVFENESIFLNFQPFSRLRCVNPFKNLQNLKRFYITQ